MTDEPSVADTVQAVGSIVFGITMHDLFDRWYYWQRVYEDFRKRLREGRYTTAAGAKGAFTRLRFPAEYQRDGLRSIVRRFAALRGWERRR